MVKLFVDDFEQLSLLEYTLVQADIPYEIELAPNNCYVRPPYLVVDGVPLDTQRAMKWIRGRVNNG